MGGSNANSPTKRMGIYAITNTVNGKRYVGSAAQFSRRWAMHKHELAGRTARGRHHSQILQHAWDKYGEAAFTFTIIEFVDDKRILLAREQYYLDTLKPEYNICLTAGSRIGTTNTEEHRQRQRAAFSTPESQTKLSARWKGKTQSEEHRAAIGEKLKGNTNGKGHKISPETRAKMNAARAAKIASGELDITKPTFSAEARERCRQAAIAYHAARRAAKAQGDAPG